MAPTNIIQDEVRRLDVHPDSDWAQDQDQVRIMRVDHDGHTLCVRTTCDPHGPDFSSSEAELIA